MTEQAKPLENEETIIAEGVDDEPVEGNRRLFLDVPM